AWPGSTCAYAKFNVTKAPFGDVRVRQAIHLATQYVANEDANWGANFYALGGVLNNAFPEAYQPADIAKMPGWRTDKSADLKTANDLLTAAGFPQGQGLSFKITEFATNLNYGYDFAVRQVDNLKQAFPKIDVQL